MMKTYTELLKFSTFGDRLNYLLLSGTVGKDTFGFDRYVNQIFYRSKEWKSIRDQVILRDLGCDLGLDGYDICGRILVHHMNPIGLSDLTDRSDFLLNPEYLICVSHDTHNKIHYGVNSEPTLPITRTKGDTTLWNI